MSFSSVAATFLHTNLRCPGKSCASEGPLGRRHRPPYASVLDSCNEPNSRTLAVVFLSLSTTEYTGTTRIAPTQDDLADTACPHSTSLSDRHQVSSRPSSRGPISEMTKCVQ
jgi:hypothetical protein